MHLEVFYNHGCPVCEEVKKDLLLPLEKQGLIQITWRNIDDPDNYFPLLQAQTKFAKTYHSPTIVASDFMLTGETEIREQLQNHIKVTNSESSPNHNLTSKVEYRTQNTKGQLAEPSISTANLQKLPTMAATTTVASHKQNLSMDFYTVTLAGLADSINPCALATIIFFIAYLRIRKLNWRTILFSGLAFCFGVFVTYIAIGYGLLKIIYQFDFIFQIRNLLNWLMSIGCFVLAGLSLFDAYMCHKSPSNKMVLQLPTWAKTFIHSKIRSNYLNSSQGFNVLPPTLTSRIINHCALGLSAFLLGMIISIVEGLCTGQVYLPTIVYLAKEKNSIAALIWLVWYNLLFILPLLVLLGLVVFGFSQKRIEEWFQKQLVWSKLLLAMFFVGIGLTLLLVK